MATMITVHARPTRRDILVSRLAVYFGSPFGKILSVAALGLPAMYLMMSNGGGRPDLGLAVPVLAGLLVLPAAFTFAGINSPTVKHLMEQGQKYVFNETGVETSNPLGQVQLRWDAVGRTYENSERFVLLVSGALMVIPTRNFENPSQVESFRELLKRRSTVES